MKPLTEEWIDKAEGDYYTAQREVNVSDMPNFDAATYHAQQCVEKYLKAKLIEEGITFPKTHDLVILLTLLLPDYPHLAIFRSEMNSLSSLAVEIRYPGANANREDAFLAVEISSRIRSLLRSILNID
jgi:HEPN domain-containing protein